MATESPEDIRKRCMPKIIYEKLDGQIYQKWTAPCMPHEQYMTTKELNFQPNDVFLSGWPRSGNHWTYFIVDMILKQSTVPAKRSYVDSMPELWSDEQRAESAAEPSPRLFSTHSKLKRFPDITKKKTKIIYIIRSPKDAWVSFHKLFQTFTEEFRFDGPWEDFFELSFGGEMTWGTWFNHVLDFEKFIAENPDNPVYIHQFEEMKLKPVECIKKLCAFLEVPDDMAEEIAKATSIEGMKNAVQSQTSTNQAFFSDNNGAFVQKGSIGNWKNVFTVSQNERFNQCFEEKMKDSKLAQLVRQYI